MSPIEPDPWRGAGVPRGALALLYRRKALGRVRLARRRARSLGGAISILAGVLLLGLWIASIVFRSSLIERTSDAPSPELVRLGLTAYLGFVAFSSLSFRGVYLPKPELERLLASPLPRAALVRYRMAGSMLTSLPFTVIVALFLVPRFDAPWIAACAIALTIPAGAVFGQGLSLAASRAGGVFERTLGRVPPIVLRVVGAVGIVALFAFLAFGPGLDSSGAGSSFREAAREAPSLRGRGGGLGSLSGLDDGTESARQRIDGIAGSRWVATLTLPLEPWARALTARSWTGALPWLAAIAVLLVLMFEFVARLPIDFREASLATSAELESRLARIRSGQGGAGVFGTSRRAKGWRVPWFFGRGPFGAVVWQRSTWLVRQARGTLLVAGVVAIVGVVAGTRVFDNPDVGPFTIAVLGVVYLSSGIRADFRADLDRLETLKTWPLATWKLFVGTLLPGTGLTIAIVWGVLLTRAAILDQFGPTLPASMLLVPFVAYVWVSVDNAVFLLFPVRFVPGQGSALQHTGRGFLLVMLRGLLLLVSVGVALGGGVMLYFLLDGPGDGAHTAALTAAGAWGLATAAGVLVGVTAAGAWSLRRFDVAKIPGSSD